MSEGNNTYEVDAETLQALMNAGKIKSFSIEATVIRANGNREELGTIAEYHAHPIKHAYAQVKLSVKRFLTWLQSLQIKVKK